MGGKRAILDGTNKLCKRCNIFKNAFIEFYKGKAVCKDCHLIEQREYYERDTIKINRRNLRTRYNLTEEDFKLLEDNSKGLCGLCHKPAESNNILVIDHNHSTNKVRELIHRKCNLLLGYAKDDKTLLNAAIEYLEKHK